MKWFDTIASLLASKPHLNSTEIDWTELVEEAESKKLLPTLSEAVLHPEVRGLVPDQVMTKLTESSTRRTLVEIHRAGHLIEILEAFRESGIAVKSFKGLTLAQLAYGRVSARGCLDIDLLVKKEDFPRALELLFSLGFEYEMANQPQCYSLFNYGVPLRKGSQNLTVDLHHALFDEGVYFPLEEYWKSDDQVEIQSVQVPTFSPEQTFVYLALHGTKHCWYQLRWLLDMSKLRPLLDITEVRRLAVKQRCQRAVGLAFALLEAIWGESIPDGFEAEPALVDETIHYLRGQTPSWPAYHAYQRKVPDTLAAQLKLLLHTWFYPQIHDLKMVDLPPRLWFVYYALRPIRILGQKLISMGGHHDR